MNNSTKILAASADANRKKQKRILDHMTFHSEDQAVLARKAYRRVNWITIAIIFLVMIPLILYTIYSLNQSFKPDYPDGATQEVRGHISRYEDTFWYTDSSQKYEFDFETYGVDESFEPGEIILIYLDENNQVVSIAHEAEDYGLYAKLILMYVIPVVLLMAHAFIGRKTYGKDWTLYCHWYEKEIEPYIFQPNFDEIIAEKKYYDVTVDVKDLNPEDQKLYKKYRNRNVVYYIMLLACIVATIYICITLELNPYSWLVIGGIVVYVALFYFLISDCDAKMEKIKSGYIRK